MTARPRPFLRLVVNQPLGDPLLEDEGDDWALNDADEVFDLRWAPAPVIAAYAEPSSLTELVGLWGSLTSGQRQWVLRTVRMMAEGEVGDY